jgi:hypothetical protein
MKLFSTTGEVREVKHYSALSGTRLEKLELSPADIIELNGLTGKQLKEWIERVYMRIGPQDFKQGWGSSTPTVPLTHHQS